ncbi:hypothetical protein [Vibrio gallicus]|uniref:hypothetical protein n=1 Tax=Vibrio gallicus TaxID=190897 RepID=UPI0021C2DF6F|nr:hypothetical protein [Vibrio gallicus]
MTDSNTSTVLSVRMTSEEKKAFQAKAKKLGISTKELLFLGESFEEPEEEIELSTELTLEEKVNKIVFADKANFSGFVYVKVIPYFDNGHCINYSFLPDNWLNTLSELGYQHKENQL